MNISSDKFSAIRLTDWQKRQAAMLYCYSSLNYIRALHRMVTSLIDGVVDPLLLEAKLQNRDSVLTDPRWGNRNTSDNWSNNAWPFLKEYQASLAKDMAGRAFERYEKTGTNDCFRGIAEYSMQWATIEEEEMFEDAVRAISSYANKIDKTLDDYQESRWTDSGFTHAYQEYRRAHPEIPMFRVREDVTGESGKTPVRTGVYVSQDDSNAALQFAWIGNGGGKLRASKTFNEIGLAALEAVGRESLWLNEDKMFDFAMQNGYSDIFRPTIYMLNEEHREFSSIAVSKVAYENRPCKWYFVEIIDGEFEEIRGSQTQSAAYSGHRIDGGAECMVAGYYFTPARPNSRQFFSATQATPRYDSEYGRTIWQWDPDQTKDF